MLHQITVSSKLKLQNSTDDDLVVPPKKLQTRINITFLCDNLDLNSQLVSFQKVFKRMFLAYMKNPQKVLKISFLKYCHLF